MSLPIETEPYFDLDVVKENIEESGNTTNEAKLQNWGDECDREIDTKLFYLFTTFPLTEAGVIADEFDATDFYKVKQLSNERLEAKFWSKTNSDQTLLAESDKHIEEFREKLTQIPATTE